MLSLKLSNFKRIIKNRRFLLAVFLLFITEVSFSKDFLHQIEFPQMGTKFYVKYYHSATCDVNLIDSIIKSRIDELNIIFSDYREDSDINKIVKTNARQKLKPEIFEVLVQSERAFDATAGNYDITIGSLTKLWRRMKRQNKIQSKKNIKNAQKLVNFNLLNFNKTDSTIQVENTNILLDFGGIVKGYALDEIKKVFEHHSIFSFFIEAGGNILVGESSTEGWKVLIGSDVQVIQNKAISTSGDYFQKVEIDGKIYSHILKKNAKQLKNKHNQITVFGDSGIVTDWISTSYFLVSNQKFRKIARKNKVKYVTYSINEGN